MVGLVFGGQVTAALYRLAGEQLALRSPGGERRSELFAVQMATLFLYSRLVETSVPALRGAITKG